MHQRQKTKTRWPGGKRHRGLSAGLLTIDIGAHFFRFVARIAQPVHRRAQLCLGLVLQAFNQKIEFVRVHNFIALIIGRKIDACPVGKPQNGAFASFETVSLVDGYCIILERLGNKQLEKG